MLSTFGTGSVREWKELARRAEALGYDALLAPDHLDGPQLAPVPAIAVAAEVSEMLKLGCHVFNNDLRHPAVLARDLATLDVVSEGRLEVGMGAGWKPVDYALRGTQPDDADTRIERLAEAIAAMKVLLTGETLTRVGEHYTFSGFRLSPPPVQRPRPPLMIGGGGRKVLQLAAREADIIGFNLALGSGSVKEALRTTSLETTARKVAWVREAVAGRLDAPELSIFVYVTEIGARMGDVTSARAAEFGMSVGELRESPHALVGSVEDVVDKLEQQRSQLGISYVCVSDRAVDAFSAVVGRLSGR